MARLGFDKKFRSFRNKKPSKIKTKGARIDKNPKFLYKILFIAMADSPLLVKERKNKTPVKIRKKAKIE